MGKRIGVVFPRQVRLSNAGGSSRLYTHDMEMAALLGQGDVVLIHGTIYALDPSTEVVVGVFQSSNRNDMPRNNGFLVNPPGTSTFNTVTNFLIKVPADTMGLLEVTLTVQKTAGSSEVKADCEITATIITNGA